MLGLVFTGDCLVYYVRSLFSLTPTRKKKKFASAICSKIKKRVASRSLRSLEKNRSFSDFLQRESAQKNLKKSSRARASRAHKFCFSICKDLSRFQDQFSVSQLKKQKQKTATVLYIHLLNYRSTLHNSPTIRITVKVPFQQGASLITTSHNKRDRHI